MNAATYDLPGRVVYIPRNRVPRPAGVGTGLGRVWAAPDPRMLKASHKRSKTFAQLVAIIQYCWKMLETLRSDLSRQ